MVENAACKGSKDHTAQGPGKGVAQAHVNAKKVCAQCPVFWKCREWVDEFEPALHGVSASRNGLLGRMNGVWAGETPVERGNRRRTVAAASLKEAA